MPIAGARRTSGNWLPSPQFHSRLVSSIYPNLSCLWRLGSCSLPFLFLSQSGRKPYWHTLTDRTFTGVFYITNCFDLIYIPYLYPVILAVSGLHLRLVYDYYKYRRRSWPAAVSTRMAARHRSPSPFFTSATSCERLVEAASRFVIRANSCASVLIIRRQPQSLAPRGIAMREACLSLIFTAAPLGL